MKSLAQIGAELAAHRSDRFAALRPHLHGAGVLAGAYRGKDIAERALLIHCVSDCAFTLGRLSREPAQALCDRKLSEVNGSLVDEGGWRPLADVTCPRCLRVLGS